MGLWGKMTMEVLESRQNSEGKVVRKQTQLVNSEYSVVPPIWEVILERRNTEGDELWKN